MLPHSKQADSRRLKKDLNSYWFKRCKELEQEIKKLKKQPEIVNAIEHIREDRKRQESLKFYQSQYENAKKMLKPSRSTELQERINVLMEKEEKSNTEKEEIHKKYKEKIQEYEDQLKLAKEFLVNEKFNNLNDSEKEALVSLPIKNLLPQKDLPKPLEDPVAEQVHNEMSYSKLGERQQDVLQFIQRFPHNTESELLTHFKISQPRLHELLKKLQEKEMIIRDEGGRYSIS